MFGHLANLLYLISMLSLLQIIGIEFVDTKAAGKAATRYTTDFWNGD